MPAQIKCHKSFCHDVCKANSQKLGEFQSLFSKSRKKKKKSDKNESPKKKNPQPKGEIMSYPRLAFANQIPPASSDAEVIQDLKLDLVLPSEVTDFLLLSPDKDTLLMRREAFSLMLADKNAEEKLTEITELLCEAELLYKALTAAVSEKAAAYVFVTLFTKIARFCTLANGISGYGALFSRFASALNELSGRAEFKTATAEAEGLEKRLAEVNLLTLKTDSESIVASKGEHSGITASLRACARELGIEIIEKPFAPITLQKGVAEAFGTIYPEVFAELAKFLAEHRTLITGELFEYIPELKFFNEALKFTKMAAENGIPYCFPSLSEAKAVNFKAVYDITLLKKGCEIVPNDVYFDKKEPFFYLTGANGGGKTTYIRAVGGAMLLFLAGMPVFCEGGEASLLSSVYAHFPRDERFEGTGRFLDEKKRVDAILERQDGNALILLNETFATTGEEKAIEQTGILADTLYSSGSFGLYITHQHGVSKTEIPFLGVTVDENDRNRRTYKIEKKRLPPKSFARDILEKYRLDAESLKNRFKG